MLPHVLNDAFIDAAVVNALPRAEDFNGAQFEGTGVDDSTIRIIFRCPKLWKPSRRA